MKAALYTRVSTADQADHGVSLDAQADRLTAFCHAKGWTLVQTVREEGWSGKDLDRPGLQALLAQAATRPRPFDALVVCKLDRLTRSVRDLAWLLDEFRRRGVAFVSLDESVDTASAAGELFLNIIASISQWERRAIGERTAAALRHLKRQGRRVSGIAPYGWTFIAGRLAPEPAEQRTLIAIRAKLGTGSLRRVAAELAAEGYVSRAGRPFAPMALARLRS